MMEEVLLKEGGIIQTFMKHWNLGLLTHISYNLWLSSCGFFFFFFCLRV